MRRVFTELRESPILGDVVRPEPTRILLVVRGCVARSRCYREHRRQLPCQGPQGYNFLVRTVTSLLIFVFLVGKGAGIVYF